jgi:hypothetical protein
MTFFFQSHAQMSWLKIKKKKKKEPFLELIYRKEPLQYLYPFPSTFPSGIYF